MITVAQHIEIGHILGYPPCCVQAWAADPDPGRCTRRGTVEGPRRTQAEADMCNVLVSDLLGTPWMWATRHRRYVPCEVCLAG